MTPPKEFNMIKYEGPVGGLTRVPAVAELIEKVRTRAQADAAKAAKLARSQLIKAVKEALATAADDAKQSQNLDAAKRFKATSADLLATLKDQAA